MRQEIFVNMVSSGRKHYGKSWKGSLEEKLIKAYDFEKNKDLSDSDESISEGKIPLIYKHGGEVFCRNALKICEVRHRIY